MSDEGFPEAVEQFVERLGSCQDRLYAYILMLLSNRDAAQDVLQETNLVLWRKAGEFDKEQDFGAWACRIAYFQVLAWYRDKNRDRLIFDQDLLNQLSAEAQPLSGELNDRCRALRLCMVRLSERMRDLLRHRYGLNWSIKQIAEKFGQTPGAVATSLCRARHELLLCIEDALQQEDGS